VEANGRGVDLGHMQSLNNSCTEIRVGTTGEELVKLNQKTGVWVVRLDFPHGALVPHAASSGFKINTHFRIKLCPSANTPAFLVYSDNR